MKQYIYKRKDEILQETNQVTIKSSGLCIYMDIVIIDKSEDTSKKNIIKTSWEQ